MKRRLEAAGLFLALLAAGCIPEIEPPPPSSFSTELSLASEDGSPVAAAAVELDDRTLMSDRDGVVELVDLAGPTVAVVRAEGHLPEPVVVGWSDAGGSVAVRLLRDGGGRRVVMHFAGDAMFGRRYEQPRSGEPLIDVRDAAPGARAVVAHAKRAFAAADLRSLNLETVVSQRGHDDAYPGKRFLLRSDPGALSALDELQADVVGFANNHARDWLDQGVRDTLQALEQAGVPQVGGGMSAEQAERPLILETGGARVGLLAYTSVTGSFVNDNYPDEDAPVPGELLAKEAWLYERRPLDRSQMPTQLTAELPDGPVRIGTAWRAFDALESELDEAEVARAWAAMVATFPELQDWVARRGHGGSAMWRRERGEQIAALADEVDLAIVQLHSGYQFQAAPSASVIEAARIAIDAGADAVIAHHPHVLQGLEWYKGKLIAYSLGNFIFDQDFLSTFASSFLRLVFEDRTLIEARLLPLELIDYKPMPVTDQAALHTLRTVWERSLLPAACARDGGGVFPFERERDAHSKPAQLRFERHTARLVDEPAREQVRLQVPGDGVVELDPAWLPPGRLGLAASAATEREWVYVGRDLFGWGHFEDVAADRSRSLSAHWALGHHDKQIVAGSAAAGRGLLRLSRSSSNQSLITFRPVARIPLSRHRLWRRDSTGPVAVDPEAHYTMRFSARGEGDVRAAVRVDIYHFDDTNPTEDPTSEKLARVEIPLDKLTPRFSTLSIDIDPAAASGGDKQANMVLFYLTLAPPERGEATLEVDDLHFIEWRDAAAMPDQHGAYTHVKAVGAPAELQFEVLTAAPR